MPFEEILGALGLDRPAAVEAPPGRTLYAPAHDPDDPGNSQSFSVAAGTPLDVPLGFVAGSVIVDNNTSAYANLPDATKDGVGRWVGPGQPGAFPILGHVSRARIAWTAPPGKTQPAINPGEVAQFVFFAAPVPPGFGVATPVGPTRASAFASASRPIGTYPFDIPPSSGFKGLIVYVTVTAGGGTVTVTISNHDTPLNVDGGVLASIGLVAGQSIVLYVYPGTPPVANAAAGFPLGQTPRISAAVTVGNATFAIDYDQVP